MGSMWVVRVGKMDDDEKGRMEEKKPNVLMVR